MHKPSDYGHAYGKKPPSHWVAVPASSLDSDASAEAPDGEHAAPSPSLELATFRLLYESDTLCLFETRDGHVTAVATDRLG